MKKLLLLFTLLTAAAGFAKAEATKTDNIDNPTKTLAYADHEFTGSATGTKYDFHQTYGNFANAGGDGCNYQITQKKSSYITNKDSKGFIRTISLNLIKGQIKVFADNEPYTEYGSTKPKGENIATETSTGKKTITIDGNYKYFYIAANTSSAVNINDISFTWAEEIQESVEPTTVTFTPEGGTYSAAQTVTLEADGNDANGKAWPIYYTVDGTEPTAESTLYTEPITVDESMTVKAIAVGATTTTDVAVAEYVINQPAPSAPVISANGMVIPNESEGYEIEMGTVITIVSENATSIVITPEDGEAVTVEGPEATYTVTASGLYTFEGVNSKGSADAMIEFVVTIPKSTTDSLTPATLSIYCKNSAYSVRDYTGSVTYKIFANAVYSGSANENLLADGFGMRDNNKTSNGGLVVTESNKYAHSVSLTQISTQTTSRKIKIIGSDKPYESCQFSKDGSFEGTELVEVALVKGEAVKYTFTENYKYIAIQSVGGACQFSEIAIEWGEMLAVEEPVAPAAPVIKEMVNGSIDAAVGETVTISGEEGSIVYVKETRQDEPEIAPYAVDVDGWMTDNADTYVYTIPEYPAIVEAKSVRQNVESPVTVFNVGDGKISTGIESVAADSDKAEAEYFNLQGIRVDNPQGGVFIRRQGAKVAKVAL
ncbi:MAG: chitobiase/beta-hexosaminidase C-terminal domain-containing protein [Muribaculaceae bacterium]|nr:chitobiase/beta-hexosaminidase C-terminal domain-containing protein [Muribaculaceae bacterium]